MAANLIPGGGAAMTAIDVANKIKEQQAQADRQKKIDSDKLVADALVKQAAVDKAKQEAASATSNESETSGEPTMKSWYHYIQIGTAETLVQAAVECASQEQLNEPEFREILERRGANETYAALCLLYQYYPELVQLAYETTNNAQRFIESGTSCL